MKKRPTLSADVRSQTGHKVKSIRKQGCIPATVYGHKYKSQSLSVKSEEFYGLYSDVGETGLLDLAVESTKVPVLIHSIQRHPVNQTILHVEFFKVNLTEKIKADIPVVISGTSPAVEQHIGNLLTVIQEIEVEALPDELPESILVDVSNLAAVDDQILVSHISVPEGVEILTEQESVVVKIGALVVEKEPEPEPETSEETAEAEEKTEAADKQEDSPTQE